MRGDSARPAKIFGVSANAFFPFLLLALNTSYATLFFAITIIIAFIILERFKYSPKVFFRAVIMFFSTKIKRKRRTITFNKLRRES